MLDSAVHVSSPTLPLQPGGRRLLPRTVLARFVERTTQLSAWTVRKADEQGTIQPDVRGRFAGHAVHYYDAARIPALIEELSQKDPWPLGALVIHSQHGPGRIEEPRAAGLSEVRMVHFFSGKHGGMIPVRELRHLISTCAVASRLGVSRKSFAKQAARKGIMPDYSADGGFRQFFDEGRIEEIRRRWHAAPPSGGLQPGRSIVVDHAGDVAKVESLADEARLRYVDNPKDLRIVPICELRELGSLRELARNENMSRYKLQRLLAAVGLHPLYVQGRTMYFDVNGARDILRDRMDRESSAVSLTALSRRTGLSPEVLARKIRHGCIRTLGQRATHTVDEQEAQRIEQLMAALRGWEGLPSLGICGLNRRGRLGHEVATWDVAALINVAQRSTPVQRRLLFDQVAWLCEGAGQERLGEALDCYLTALPNSAQILLPLFSHLPSAFERHRIRLLFILSRGKDIYSNVEPYLHTLAGQVGATKQQRYKRFRWCIDKSLAALLTSPECRDLFREVRPRRGEDDFVPGAIVATFTDDLPKTGVIVRVEKRSWNPIAGRWDKTILVRFAEGERRINPHTRKAGTTGLPPAAVLLRASEANDLFRTVLQLSAAHPTARTGGMPSTNPALVRFNSAMAAARSRRRVA